MTWERLSFFPETPHAGRRELTLYHPAITCLNADSTYVLSHQFASLKFFEFFITGHMIKLLRSFLDSPGRTHTDAGFALSAVLFNGMVYSHRQVGEDCHQSDSGPMSWIHQEIVSSDPAKSGFSCHGLVG